MNDQQKPPQFVPLTAVNSQGDTGATQGLEFAASVQKPKPKILLPGVPAHDPRPGKVLVSVVVQPNAGGLILVQLEHPDGTILGLLLDPDTYKALQHCLGLANSQLVTMETLAQAPKPS